jgi:hypothetical protein
VYGDLCPTAYKQGYGTGTQHSCIYKKYNWCKVTIYNEL